MNVMRFEEIGKEKLESMDKWRLIADNATDVIWLQDVDSQTFTYMSPPVERMLGFTAKEMINRNVAQSVTPASLEVIQKNNTLRIEEAKQGIVNFHTDEIEFIHKYGHIVPVEINMYFMMNTNNGLVECAGVMRDITKRKIIESERETLIVHLQKALADVKILKGVVPICCYCKKIRDNKGYWNQLESYMHNHYEVQFSHGICQECAKKHYPDINIYKE